MLSDALFMTAAWDDCFSKVHIRLLFLLSIFPGNAFQRQLMWLQFIQLPWEFSLAVV